MDNVTAERIAEQQERLQALEIALEKQERKLRKLRRMYRLEADLYERMIKAKQVAVFVPVSGTK